FFRLTLLIPTDIITEHSGVHQGGRSPVLLALFRCSSSTSFGSISSEQHTHQRAAPFLDLPVEEEQIEKFQPFILLKSFLPPILGVATDGLRSSRSQQEEFLKSSQWWLSASSAKIRDPQEMRLYFSMATLDFFSVVLLIALAHSLHSSEIPTENAKLSLTLSSSSKDDSDKRVLRGNHQRRHMSRKDRDRVGLSSQRPRQRLEEDGPSLEALSPVKLELRPGGGARSEVYDETRGPAHLHQGRLLSEGESSRKGRRHGHRHLADHRKNGGKKEKGRVKGDVTEPQFGSFYEEGLYTSPPHHNSVPLTEAPASLVPILVSSAAQEHPPTLPPASAKSQGKVKLSSLLCTKEELEVEEGSCHKGEVSLAHPPASPSHNHLFILFLRQHFTTSDLSRGKSGRRKTQGEVMPTFDMALFDWTDYEDMRPIDSGPSRSRKEKGRGKMTINWNSTADPGDIEQCDHHLDCLPGKSYF
ncbi:hypothetical protein DNTS_032568, partial [Danionella cerebrum]